MKIGCLLLAAILVLCPSSKSQGQTNDSVQDLKEGAEVQPTQSQSAPPNDYLIVLFPIPPGPEGFWIAKSTDGNLDILPFSTLGKDYNKGKEPVTFSLLIENEEQLLRQIDILQRKVSDLESDYNLLAQRYNRLASVSSAIPVAQRPSEDSANRNLIIQYLLLRRLTASPPLQLSLPVEPQRTRTDCESYVLGGTVHTRCR